jgi:hypothetical protein
LNPSASSIGNDFWDANLELGLVGGVAQDKVPIQARLRDIVSHVTELVLIIRREIVGEVDGGKGFHMLEDGIELGLKGDNLVSSEIETCQFGDITDIDVVLRHEKLLVLRW